jgi:uncharacterized membrane protein
MPPKEILMAYSIHPFQEKYQYYMVFILGFCILLYVLYQGYWKNIYIYIFTAHTGTMPQHYKSTQVNHLQNRKRLREQVTRQQQNIKILTRRPKNNGRSFAPISTWNTWKSSKSVPHGIHQATQDIPQPRARTKIIVYSAWRWPARTETCSGEINVNKHLKKLLWGTVLPITLIPTL